MVMDGAAIYRQDVEIGLLPLLNGTRFSKITYLFVSIHEAWPPKWQKTTKTTDLELSLAQKPEKMKTKNN